LTHEPTVVNLGTNPVTLRKEFIAWQCRLRKHAMREAGGRPSQGMRPRAFDEAGEVIADAITVLLVRADSAQVARLLEFQFKRTQDPLDRYEKAVTAFSAEYYQDPANFSGVMSALFNGESATLRRLLDSTPDARSLPRCVLVFEERTRRYRVPCAVEPLASDDALSNATYWHNALFNPDLPPGVVVVAFVPDWVHASRM